MVWVECRLGSLSSRSVGERFVLVESGLGSVSSRSVEERRRGGLLQVSSLSLVSSRRLLWGSVDPNDAETEGCSSFYVKNWGCGLGQGSNHEMAQGVHAVCT